jgi:hypothetical protein
MEAEKGVNRRPRTPNFVNRAFMTVSLVCEDIMMCPYDSVSWIVTTNFATSFLYTLG